MGYICYLHTHGSSVPHMELIHGFTLDEAIALAGRMFANHTQAIRAELFQGDEHVATVTAEEVRKALRGTEP